MLFEDGEKQPRIGLQMLGLHRFARVPLEYQAGNAGDVTELAPRHLADVDATADIVEQAVSSKQTILQGLIQRYRRVAKQLKSVLIACDAECRLLDTA